MFFLTSSSFNFEEFQHLNVSVLFLNQIKSWLFLFYQIFFHGLEWINVSKQIFFTTSSTISLLYHLIHVFLDNPFPLSHHKLILKYQLWHCSLVSLSLIWKVSSIPGFQAYSPFKYPIGYLLFWMFFNFFYLISFKVASKSLAFSWIAPITFIWARGRMVRILTKRPGFESHQNRFIR